ncbi:MAG: 4Fe-4S dicluster domain-containing protein [Bacteroidota bacterium]
MDRRSFVRTLGAVGGSLLAVDTLKSEESGNTKELYGILIDATRCVGCRTCEEVCASAHGLPVPDTSDMSVFDKRREPTETQWTVVNRFETTAGELFAKKQCMHCVQPACASACLTKAMYKTENGPVIWREEKCMGCRFCMVSCPFDIPKFEYNSAVPKIQKCVMCWDQVREGKKPVCVENCPAEALLFGKRKELLEIARSRIYSEPDKYVHHIYGEYEAGGTGVLYLSSVPFEQLGFNTDIGTTSYPELTTGFLYAVPIVLTLWPAFLLALSNATRRNEPETERDV